MHLPPVVGAEGVIYLRAAKTRITTLYDEFRNDFLHDTRFACAFAERVQVDPEMRAGQLPLAERRLAGRLNADE